VEVGLTISVYDFLFLHNVMFLLCIIFGLFYLLFEFLKVLKNDCVSF